QNLGIAAGLLWSAADVILRVWSRQQPDHLTKLAVELNHAFDFKLPLGHDTNFEFFLPNILDV
ncbi:MAG TPA: hypothetical protein VF988_17210, partial [Verrucomicrobiae bacterium]